VIYLIDGNEQLALAGVIAFYGVRQTRTWDVAP